MAADLIDNFADGAFFAPLAPVSDPGLVAATIAQTLEVREAADRPLLESLKDFLRGKQMLLLLDNFEQAELLLAQSLAIGQSLGNAEIIANSLMQRGVTAHRQGDYRAAQPSPKLPLPQCGINSTLFIQGQLHQQPRLTAPK